MGDADKQDGKKYQARDARIIRGLRSTDSAQREEAMDLLEKGLRWPLALLLRKFAQQSISAAFEIIVDENLRVDKAEYEPIWQETIACLCENVKKENFEINKSLFAYLGTIARRLIEKQYRQVRGFRQSESLGEIDLIEGKSSNDLEEAEEWEKLLKIIAQFYVALNENNKVVMRIGMRRMTDDDSSPKSMKVFAQKIHGSKAWNGSDETILRRYGRLLENLRKYLKDQGYHV